MNFKRFTALILALSLLFCTPVAAADSGGTPKDSLRGKTMLILGDSYSAGYGLDHMADSWTDLIADAFDMTLYNVSISGSSFASGVRGKEPMVERCEYLVADEDVDIVILQGGSNDHAKSIPLGTPDSRDPETCLGAMNLILDTLQEKYPQADLLCFTPWVSTGHLNSYGLDQSDYVEGMLAVCEMRDVLCYDASDTAANGMYIDSESFRRRFLLSARDPYHLNQSGHRRFASTFAAWLCENLCGGEPADCFADLISAPEDIRDAVSALAPTGLLVGEDGVFSPAAAVTRGEFAMILYEWADCPPAYDYTFTDVSPEDPYYDAICYVMDTGIFYPTDTFWPDHVLTRQTAAVALCNLYTEVLGCEITEYASTGSYADADSVDGYAKIPLGWAIHEDLLGHKGGYLYPQEHISRGDLAVALTAFLRLLWEIT